MTNYQILVGNCLEVLRGLPANTFQTVATSPPYFGLRNYNLPPCEWLAVEYAPMAGLPPVTVPVMSCCLGLEPDPVAYIGHLVLIWREVWRVLRDDGVCWLNLGDSYCNAGSSRNGQGLDGRMRGGNSDAVSYKARDLRHSLDGVKHKDLLMVPARAALALQADGWYLRSAIVWAKGVSFCPTYSGSVMPESVTDRPTNAHEMVYLLAKSPRYFYDAEAVREKWADERCGNAGSYRYAQREDAGLARRGNIGTGNAPMASGRNLRNCWVLSPRGNAQAHFATWPEDLVRPMLQAGASKAGCCAACGAPWERVVEVVGGGPQRGNVKARDGIGDDTKGSAGQAWMRWKAEHPNRDLGFRPTCACDAGTVPCRVLDPFAGSGTTGRVARQLGLEFTGIEMNPEYAEMARANIEAYHKAIPRPAREMTEQPALELAL